MNASRILVRPGVERRARRSLIPLRARPDFLARIGLRVAIQLAARANSWLAAEPRVISLGTSIITMAKSGCALLLCLYAISSPAQPVKVGEINSYVFLPQYLQPYKK